MGGCASELIVGARGRRLKLTNLDKVFWPALGLTKGHLLHYYLQVAPVLVPHLRDRPMVLRRYPDGVDGASFFMKRVPTPRPEWLVTHRVRHADGARTEVPLIQDPLALLWCVNLGCIDLNPWSARIDALEQPDVLYFDLDPGDGVPFAVTRQAALVVRDVLTTLRMTAHVKTSGSRGMHVAVPLVRGPTHAAVQAFARAVATEIAQRHPRLFTVTYARARRPPGRVLLDYNQNGRGKTLASVYSVRPHPRAAVSTPLTWAEVERGCRLEDHRIGTVPGRLARRGDLWRPLLRSRRRVNLARWRAS